MMACSTGQRTRPQVCDHTMVSTSCPPSWDFTDDFAHDEMTGAVHRLLADSRTPMSAMEIAHRMSLPRVVATTIITHLARQGLVQISPLTPSAGFLSQAIAALTGDQHHRAASLSSMKIIVTGPAGAGVSTFVGAAARHAPVRLLETIPDRAGALTSYCLEQGAVDVSPNGRVHLLAAPPPAVFDALWVDVTRAASAILVLVNSHRPWTAIPVLEAAHETRLPLLMVVNHIDSSHPDPSNIAARFGVESDLIHITDARSRPATRSTLARLLRRVEAASTPAALRGVFTQEACRG
ncbi:hypothetical protein BJF83_22920 [Nocardiopsis sp. CNR-923]|uniref:hypothetical protein n=1 Tax=Nocardiopsis sp. CNR-923 TaxID=1904965 RepID=UPI000964493D|nr:hypothetical protein [Nocardiopsis sp. CNR-923]OLT25414.1 hypothetical protein BJF83_22920 [Nocardiopsis sp. CNR-923]